MMEEHLRSQTGRTTGRLVDTSAIFAVERELPRVVRRPVSSRHLSTNLLGGPHILKR